MLDGKVEIELVCLYLNMGIISVAFMKNTKMFSFIRTKLATMLK